MQTFKATFAHFSQINGALSGPGRRRLVKGRDAIRNNFPCCFGTNEDVPTDFNIRIAVDASQCDAMHSPFEHTTKRGTADAAELETVSMLTNIRGQQVLASQPIKLIRIDQGIR